MGAVAIGLNLGTGVRLARAQHQRMVPIVITAIVTLSIGLFGFSLGTCASGHDAGQSDGRLADAAAMSLVLLQLIGLFAGLSMLAFGGGAGVIPDMQRAAVDQHHWLTAGEFLDMFAISRAAPGPGSLIVLLIGLKAAGTGRRGGVLRGNVRAVLPGGARGRPLLAASSPLCLARDGGARFGPRRRRPDLRQRPRADARHGARLVALGA